MRNDLELRKGKPTDSMWGTQGSPARLIRVRGQGSSYSTQATLLGALESRLATNGILVVEESPENSGLLSYLYSNWGIPIQNIFVCTETEPSVHVMLFSKVDIASQKKSFLPWNLFYLVEEDHQITESLKNMKKPTAKGNKEILRVKKYFEDYFPQVRISGFMNGTQVDWVLNGTQLQRTKRGELIIPAKFKKKTIDGVLQMPAKEYLTEVKNLERMVRPSGMESSELKANVPSRAMRYIVDALVGFDELVIDFDSLTGDLGHAAIELANSRRPDVRLLALSEDPESFLYERLESLATGAWKDWTYHEPMHRELALT